MAKKVLKKVPKQAGVYCVKGKDTNVNTRCMRRFKSGETRYLKSGNIQCGCPTSAKKRSKKSKKR